MPIELNEKNIKKGVLSLVLALVDILRDVLKHQAVRRMEGGRLSGEEVERLGRALKDLDTAVEELKEELGIMDAVRSVREGLDGAVGEALGAAFAQAEMKGSNAYAEKA